MQGVLGGETAAQNLMALENTVLGFIQGRLPKICDPRFSKGGKRRAASIPPKTASATVGALISPNNAKLQSLVNNNAFLGRGKFSQRGHSVTPHNQPGSPPSISVQGTGNIF